MVVARFCCAIIRLPSTVLKVLLKWGQKLICLSEINDLVLLQWGQKLICLSEMNDLTWYRLRLVTWVTDCLKSTHKHINTDVRQTTENDGALLPFLYTFQDMPIWSHPEVLTNSVCPSPSSFPVQIYATFLNPHNFPVPFVPVRKTFQFWLSKLMQSSRSFSLNQLQLFNSSTVIHPAFHFHQPQSTQLSNSVFANSCNFPVLPSPGHQAWPPA